jgi:hypothetical protein
VTAGDWDGVVVELDRLEDADLTFVSGPMNVRTRLAGLPAGGRCFEARNPERTLELKRLPERMPSLAFHGGFVDPSPAAGAHAYWIRVRQADGAQAWSTPIFMNLSAR